MAKRPKERSVLAVFVGDAVSFCIQTTMIGRPSDRIKIEAGAPQPSASGD